MAGAFEKSADLVHMKEILALEAACQGQLPRWEQLTLGQLEDLVLDVLHQFSDERRCDRRDVSREVSDARQLRCHGLRPARVDVENVKNSRRLAALYDEASLALAELRAGPDNVYFWEREKKSQLLNTQLEVVKASWLMPERKAESSDSEEEVR